MCEIWKPIKGFENNYLISNYGQVKNIKTGKIRRNQIHYDGYFVLLLCVNNIRYTKYIHKLIAEVFIDNPLNLNEINHIDANKQNNNINNLEWCTHQENVNHCIKMGLIKNRIFGENINTSKLKDIDVIKIRSLKNLKTRELSDMFNVSMDTIRDILSNRTWKHLIK